VTVIVTDNGSPALTASETFTITLLLDKTPPHVFFTPIFPNPRSTSVAFVTISFDQPVTGFDLGDLKLTLGRSSISLKKARLTTRDGATYVLGGLTGLTRRLGAYTLTLKAPGSGIRSLTGNSLVTGTSTKWTMRRARRR
jgi:hypothetical protein